MSVFGDLRGWSRTRPFVADALLAVVVFAVAALARPDGPDAQLFGESTPALLLVLGASCLALVFRRRAPMTVLVVTVALAVLDVVIASGPTQVVIPAMVASYTVAVTRPRRTALVSALVTAVVLAAAVGAVGALELFSPATFALLAWGGLAVTIGIAVRGQRAVVAAAEDRALRAEQSREQEAQRRVGEERVRIARELHDVVAHHIAVINVQAGVARHLLDSDPPAAADALGHVRDASAVVLAEMPAILGLLRTSEEELATTPAPGLAQADDLVDTMRHAGLEVTWRVTGTPLDLAPGTDLTAYRLVQESLTNARKHGLGQADVEVGWHEDAVAIRVRNAMPEPVMAGVDGHGLVGMRERVLASGGTLETGPDGGGRFVVDARLPAVPLRVGTAGGPA